MSRAIARPRIINRRTSVTTSIDPAQSGACYARLSDWKLVITGIRNRVVLRAKGVRAARWENDETILLVLREEPEDEPVAIRAFRSRVRNDWETEDAHGCVHPSPDCHFVAVEFSLPNSSVAILPAARVVQDFLVRANLGKSTDSIEWIGDGHTVAVRTSEQVLQWNPGMRQFKKYPVEPETAD